MQGYDARTSEVATVLQMPWLWPQTIGMSDQSESPVSQTNQKTRAMVAKANEDDEEACTLVKVERPRLIGNSKTCDTEVLASRKGRYVQHCLPCPEQ